MENNEGFTKEELQYIKEIAKFDNEKIYLDYFLILRNIDLTLEDIKNNENLTEKEKIQLILFENTFLDLMYSAGFYSEDYVSKLKNEKPFGDDLDNTSEYKEYRRYKLTLLAILSKEKVVSKNNIESFDEEDEKNLDYATAVDLSNALSIYSKVLMSKDKINISSMKNIENVLENFDDFSKMSIEEVEFFKYIRNTLGENIDITDSKLVSYIVFMGQAFIDKNNNKEYTSEYNVLFASKKNFTDTFNFSYNEEVKDNVIAMDSIITKYSKYKGRYKKFFEEISNDYDFSSINEYEDKEEYDNINKTQLNIIENPYTEIDINGSKTKVSEEVYNQYLENTYNTYDELVEENKKLEERKETVNKILNILGKNDITLEDKDILKEEGITEEELKDIDTLMAKYTGEFSKCSNNIDKNQKKIDTLTKFRDTLLDAKPKKKVKKTDALKKWVSKFGNRVKETAKNVKAKAVNVWNKQKNNNKARVIGGIVGVVAGFMITSSSTIWLINAVEALILLEAKTFERKLIQENLPKDEMKLENVSDAPKNIVVKSAKKLYREALNFLGTYNIFNALRYNNKTKEMFSSPETMQVIINGIVAEMVAMNATYQIKNIVGKAMKPTSKTPSSEGVASNSAGTESIDEFDTNIGNGSDNFGTASQPVAPDTSATEGFHIGDKINSGINTGYKTAYDANLGNNVVNLNQNIINDGDTIISNLKCFGADGKMIDVNVPKGTDILEYLKNMEIDPSDVMANLTNTEGTGRAWVPLEDIIKTKGL